MWIGCTFVYPLIEGSHDLSARSFTIRRSYTRYASFPFDRASRNFGISCFLLSITRCDMSSFRKMPRGFSLRAACRMQSRSLYVSNLTTMVLGRPVELIPVRCARSMRIAFAWASGSFSAVAKLFLTTVSVSAQFSAAISGTPSIRRLFRLVDVPRSRGRRLSRVTKSF